MLVPILSLFFGSILRILTYVLLLFSAFCTMQLPLQASGMNKLGFMSILFIIIVLWFQWLKFGIILSAFAILIYVSYSL